MLKFLETDLHFGGFLKVFEHIIEKVFFGDKYLLFEDFYFLNALKIIPPWEQKILSKLVFEKDKVETDKILAFFRKRYPSFEKIAVHYLWEDLFWKRKQEHIEWLEKEIRL